MITLFAYLTGRKDELQLQESASSIIYVFRLIIVAASRVPIKRETPLPTHCYHYITKSEPTRHHSSVSTCCENDYSLSAGWYRFTGSGGTQLLMKPTAANGFCGASCPGWWNGTLPNRISDTTVGSVLFDNSDSCTGSIYPILATNCSGFYVFYLSPTSCCSSYRYCTMNGTD